MKLKSIMGAIVIGSILGLNAIATAIEYPELRKTEDLGEVKTVADLHGYDAEADTEVPEIVSEAPDYVTAIACDYGLDPEIVKAIIEIESGGDATAVGDDGYSVGLMQIQEQYHKERMSRLGVDNLCDPIQNVTVGCDLLSELLQKYGSYEQALSAYNSGDPYGAPEYAERILREAGYEI